MIFILGLLIFTQLSTNIGRWEITSQHDTIGNRYDITLRGYVVKEDTFIECKRVAYFDVENLGNGKAQIVDTIWRYERLPITKFWGTFEGKDFDTLYVPHIVIRYKGREFRVLLDLVEEAK